MALATLLSVSLALGIVVAVRLQRAYALEKRLQAAHKRAVSGSRTVSEPASSGSQATTTSAPWEIDFAELKLLKCVAQGSFGTVWRGTWLGTVVAIKLPHARLSREIKDKFVEEAVLMSKLHHPNIVMFIGACLNPKNLALVLEFLPRGTLHDFLLNRKNEVSLALLLRFATDVARGVKYLHTRCKIIQRDLKPLNVLLDEALNCKLCDFGLSKSMLGEEGMTACGTPYWSAPEIIRGDSYDFKADVYSFAIILCELISREEPYNNMPGMEIAVKVATQDLRPKIPSFCPENYRRLIQECWDPAPAMRPDFTEVLERLHAIKREHEAVAIVEASSEYKGERGDEHSPLRGPASGSPVAGSTSGSASAAAAFVAPSPAKDVSLPRPAERC